jgi:hypothetical protein
VIALASVNAGPIYLLAVIAIGALLVAVLGYHETKGDTWIITLDDDEDGDA